MLALGERVWQIQGTSGSCCLLSVLTGRVTVQDDVSTHLRSQIAQLKEKNAQVESENAELRTKCLRLAGEHAKYKAQAV